MLTSGTVIDLVLLTRGRKSSWQIGLVLLHSFGESLMQIVSSKMSIFSISTQPSPKLSLWNLLHRLPFASLTHWSNPIPSQIVIMVAKTKTNFNIFQLRRQLILNWFWFMQIKIILSTSRNVALIILCLIIRNYIKSERQRQCKVNVVTFFKG